MQVIQYDHKYEIINRRRQEHLSSLGINLWGKSVLELGSGAGQLTSYFLSRDCTVTSIDARAELIEQLTSFYPVTGRVIDLEGGLPDDMPAHDVVFAYGLLYHVANPERLIADFAKYSTQMALIETALSPRPEMGLQPVEEDRHNVTQSMSGMATRPTRSWVMGALNHYFPYAYMTRTQPNHDQFPIDWSTADGNVNALTRAVFIGAHHPIENPLLSRTVLDRQERHP